MPHGNPSAAQGSGAVAYGNQSVANAAPAIVPANSTAIPTRPASFLANLLEVAGAAEEAAVKTPALPAAVARKNGKEKDTPSKSDTNRQTTTATTIPTATADTQPSPIRLLPFGLTIEPASKEIGGVGRAGNKPAQTADNRSANHPAGQTDSTENTEPQTDDPSGDLAFALRLTNSDSPTSETASTQNAPAQTAPTAQTVPAASRMSAADLTSPAQPVAAVQSAQQSSTQSNGQDPGHSSKQERDDTAAATASTAPSAPSPQSASTSAAAPNVIAPPSPVQTSASTPGPAPTKDAPPTAHAAQANEVTEKPAAAPAQRISLSIADGENQRVDIHLMERAGEVRVAVHSADETLSHSMRAELGSLNGKLAQSGYGAESYAPTGANNTSFSNQRQSSDGRDSAAGDRQNGQQSQSGGQQQPSRDGRGQRPAWVEELETSLASNAANRSNQPWQRA